MKFSHQNQIIFSLSGGHLLNDFYVNFLPVLLPVIMPQLGLSLTLTGLLVLVLSLTSNLLQPVFGYFMDKHNLIRLLVPSVPFGALVICSVGWLDSQWALFLVIALTGLSVSMFHPLGSSLVGRLADAKKLGSSISYYLAGGNIGYALAPVIIAQFMQLFPLKWLPVFILPSILIAYYYHQSGLSKLSTVQESSHPAAGRIHFGTPIIILNLAMGMRTWTYMMASTYLPLYLVQRGVSPLAAGTLLTLLLAGGAFGGLLGGWAGDRIGHRRLMFIFLLASLLPTWYFYTSDPLTPLALVALFLCGAFLQGPQPSSVAWAQRLLPDNTGVASGMMMGFAFGLGSLGTAVSAALADYIGLEAALLLTIIPAAIAALLVLFVKIGHAPSQA
jgi:FSR family fosmidomycin resistance protein-like MFS transporter